MDGSLLIQSYSDVEVDARRRLAAAGVGTPDIDARALLQEASGLGRAQLILRRNDACKEAHKLRFETLVTRRLLGEPVGRILGRREFWGLEFQLSKDTLEPRPDSETLIEAVLKHRHDRAGLYHICDFGTGSGCLLGALLQEYPNAHGIGVDISREAVLTAQKNFSVLGLSARANFALGNWGDARELRGFRFDIIISNPPYIPVDTVLETEVRDHDPAAALFAGSDGLDAYRDLIPQLLPMLADGGLIVLEIGIGQNDDVCEIAARHGLKHLETRRDLGGIERAVVLVRA